MASKTRSSSAAGKREPSRVPNYGSAGRMLRALTAILSSPRGRDLDGLADELDVSRKTAERYAKVMLDAVPAPDGQPLLELVRADGGRPRLRVRGSGNVDSNAYQAASIFFALAALRTLEGTIVYHGAGDVWEKFKKSLPSDARRTLAHIERKFYYVPFAAKDYTRLDDHLDAILRAVLKQQKLAIRYRNASGRRSRHEFEPYTVILYRDALYVLGQSSRHRTPVYLAIDRIEEIERTGETFTLPPSYSPRDVTRDVPGIWSGSETQVTLRLRGRAAELIPERIVHPSQTFTPLRGGATLMRLTVRGWQELAWWVLSWGGDVEVLEPAEMRAFVRRSVQAAARLYGD